MLNASSRITLVASLVATILLLGGVAGAQLPVQIIHNSPDPAVATVDVHIDGALVLNDFSYKQASPFIDQFGNPVIVVSPTALIEVKSSDGATVLHSENLALGTPQPALIEIIGLLNPAEFDPNPNGLDTSLRLLVFEGYKAQADNPLTTELMAVHAVPDAGAVDIVVRVNIGQPGVGPALFSNLQFGDARPYLVLTPASVVLDLVETGTTNVIQSWVARFGLVAGAGAVGNAAGLVNPPVPASSLTLFGAVLTGFVFELTPTSTTDVIDALPTAPFALRDNYPNPFNPSTTIPFTLNADQKVSLKVYDLQGRLVDTLLDGELAAGGYEIPFLAPQLSSGTYLYELRTASGRQMKTMLLLK